MVYNVVIVIYWFVCLLTFRSEFNGFRIQDSGFRNRAVKHSFMTRQWIPGYKGSKKMHNSIGTLSGSFKRPNVGVLDPDANLRNFLYFL